MSRVARGLWNDTLPNKQNTLKIVLETTLNRENFSNLWHPGHPTTTGTSVLGIKFNGGVVMAADTLGSYGSLARYRSVSRLMKVNDNTIIGASGDYADFQYMKAVLEQKIIDDACLDDGHGYTPQSVFSWLTRIMYYRRTKFNPLWNEVIVGGFYKGESFLGFVDKIGIAYQSDTVASGFGAYLAQPMLRDAFEKNPNLTLEQAKKVVVDCLKVLFYRDARSLNKFEIAVITNDGTVVEEPQSADTNWSIANINLDMASKRPAEPAPVCPENQYLFKLYGEVNIISPQKRRALALFNKKQNTEEISRLLAIKKATAEVYLIDALAVGAVLDYETLAQELKITPALFQQIDAEISPSVRCLRDLKDTLCDASYNQIRFVIACKGHNKTVQGNIQVNI